MRERMHAGDLYIADDPQLRQERDRAAELLGRFNASAATDREGRARLLTELLQAFGAGAEIRPPLYCDYGTHTRIGARTYVNFGLVLLDVAPVRIGDDVQIGPYVQLLTASHPLDPRLRREKWESAQPITIGDNAWLGGGVIVCPGVSIGENSVIAAGAVVTRDVPANALAVGIPARVVRSLGDRTVHFA